MSGFPNPFRRRSQATAYGQGSSRTSVVQRTFSNGNRRTDRPSPRERLGEVLEEIPPLAANWPSTQLCIGGGVAIFHLATARVVICRHGRHDYWFLPKGRRDPNEDSRIGAEREGFEESGYRNRILPVPIPHIQPRPHNVSGPQSPNVTEPVFTQLMPFRRNVSYLLFWYVAETVPPAVERALEETMRAQRTPRNPTPYIPPPAFRQDLTLEERMEQDVARDRTGEVTGYYEPVRHEGTGVDSDEMEYESHLMDIDEACRVLGGTELEYVVRTAWRCIEERYRVEVEQEAEALEEALAMAQSSQQSSARSGPPPR